MLAFSQSDLLNLLIAAPGLLFSLTVHEFAHARVALAFGDPTAKYQGRLTLNPLHHLDPIGTIALFLAGFGWAKPVPVNVGNLRPPGLGQVCVSFAGPLSNLGLAVLFGLLARALVPLYHVLSPEAGDLLMSAILYTAAINVVLFVFNLIPLAPLDGHHIAGQMVNPWQRPNFLRWQMTYGQMVLLALLFGPRLLSGYLQMRVPDPIGWVLRHAQDIFFRVLGFG